eukprot:CAMPEP_0177560290 /NCGR_PEP_ID=MMETSP0369-20130122/71299_1 /TAXON_ID=447022 ORGANISM="Scrippsiella hangoei-like, Strain SHHI-4" /NCGR_SAMPLE_ID=MMETSP0369 /ASSEMBLY_ACC=CAM_ASM_000364 /LENGTH=79 /DNA_ID=CAMNT_0019047093 /DNA_START=10 /DNA_END=246 /DNA_ORIENTATION=+
MNVSTAVFVESASQISRVDQDLAIRDQIMQDNSNINAVRPSSPVWTATLTRAELEVLLESPETFGQLPVLGLGSSEEVS